MKFVKNMIVRMILTIFLMLGIWSCGSRTTRTEKSASENSQKLEEVQEVNRQGKSERQEEQKTESVKSTQTAISEARTDKSETQTSQERKNQNEEKAKKQAENTLYERRFYPNGQLKFEKEITKKSSEEISKLVLENEYLKSSAQALKEENTKQRQDIETYTNIVSTLKERVFELMKMNKLLSDELQTTYEEHKKETNRRAYPWYWWVIGSVVVWELLKLLWRIYKPIK